MKIENLKKQSSAQLLKKLGNAEGEFLAEIKSILEKRGVSLPAQEVKKEEKVIIQEFIAPEDQEQAPLTKSSKKAKEGKEGKKSLSTINSKASLKYEDEVFTVGAKVKVLNETKSVTAGTIAFIKQCYFIKELPEWKWAILVSEKGVFFERKLSKVEKIS